MINHLLSLLYFVCSISSSSKGEVLPASFSCCPRDPTTATYRLNCYISSDIMYRIPYYYPQQSYLVSCPSSYYRHNTIDEFPDCVAYNGLSYTRSVTFNTFSPSHLDDPAPTLTTGELQKWVQECGSSVMLEDIHTMSERKRNKANRPRNKKMMNRS